MKLFIIRFLLGIAGAWLAATFIPGITYDDLWQSLVLMGFFIAVGEVLLYMAQGGAALILFIIPRTIRIFALRAFIVAIAFGLVSGIDLTPPVSTQIIGLLGTTLIYSLLFLLPFSS